MLELRAVQAQYGKSRVLHGVTLEVRERETAVLVGRNGVGKTTTLEAILGLVDVTGGEIRFEGQPLSGLPPHQIPRRGIGYVPQGRRIFPELTVRENLEIGCVRGAVDRTVLDRVFTYFPRLGERLWQAGGTLSGGEQQMLAVARALMSRGRLMLLDEPSMGLAPVLVRDIFKVLREINQSGTTILLVEQNANMALRLADRGYVLETGNIIISGSGRELMGNPRVKEAYLGG